MGKKSEAKKASKKALKQAVKKSGLKRVPKTKCCVDKPRCSRCPIQMLKDGTLPPGYTVKKRRLTPAA